jgi:hypothetical protein
MNQTKLNQQSPDCYSYESDQTSSTVNTVIAMNQTKLHQQSPVNIHL